MEGSGFSQILSHLLRKPMSVVYSFNHEGKSPASALLLITLVCLAIFGFVIGIFSAGDQLWAAPVKVIGGVLFSALYLFAQLVYLWLIGWHGCQDSACYWPDADLCRYHLPFTGWLCSRCLAFLHIE